MLEPAGPVWPPRFPGSQSLDDLVDPFKTSAKNFVASLTGGKIEHVITATYRPLQRAYLMHWCCAIAGYRDKVSGAFTQISPDKVPPMKGVDIDWTCGGDLGAARSAAIKMRTDYGIVFPAALESNHTKRLAMDLHVLIREGQSMNDAEGKAYVFKRDGNALDPNLVAIGKTFGCLKLLSDLPHWSVDGH